jgi:hypothetical protein
MTGAGGTSAVGGSFASGGRGGSSSAETATDAGILVTPIPDAGAKVDATSAFWTTTYNTGCTPPTIGGRAESDGHHRAGEDCMRSGCHLNPQTAHHHAGTDCRGSGCHASGSPDGSGAPAFLFGGTVYRAATLVADPKVEVGVEDKQAAYVACSASNGNFWVVAPSTAGTLTWSAAKVRLRNLNGEAPMMTLATAGCNAAACHTGLMKLTSP